MMNIIVPRGQGFPRFEDGTVTVSTNTVGVVRGYHFDPANAVMTRDLVYEGDTRGGVRLQRLQFRGGSVTIIGGAPVYVQIPGESGQTSFRFPNGSVRLLVEDLLPLVGSLTKFAVSTTGLPSPADLLIETVTAGSSGAVGSPWTRHYVIFSPTTDAAFLGVGGLFNDVAVNAYQFLSKVQVERLPIGTAAPTSYSKAREIRTRVKTNPPDLPERLKTVRRILRENTPMGIGIAEPTIGP